MLGRQSFAPSSMLFGSSLLGSGAGETISLEDMSGDLNGFVSRFEVWMTKMNNQILDSRHRFQKEFAAEKEKILLLQSSIDKAEQQQQQLIKKLEAETNEIQVWEETLAELKQEHERLLAVKVETEKKLQDWADQVSSTKFSKDKKEKERQERERRQQPEIEFFEKFLSLKITPVSEGNTMFSFSCIDERNMDKEFIFILDVSEAVFKVKQCDSLSDNVLAGITEMLNNDRDFYGFLKRIRKAFVDSVQNQF